MLPETSTRHSWRNRHGVTHMARRSWRHRHGTAFSRLDEPELCIVVPPSCPRGRREGRVPAGTRGPLREMHTQEEPHSSIQVWPNARPSLRDGRTAYAVLSREPMLLSGLPHACGSHQAPRRLAPRPHPQGLTVANDGQDHTVLPYAFSAVRPTRLAKELTRLGSIHCPALLSASATTLPASTADPILGS